MPQHHDRATADFDQTIRLNPGLASAYIGTLRRSRPLGPVYEVIGKLPGDDQLMRVRVVATGEQIDYPLMRIINDPRQA